MNAPALASADLASVPAAASPRSGWLVSPSFDALFFFASCLSVLPPLVATRLFHVQAFYVLAAVAVVSNGPHLTSTWTRVYLDRREVRRRPVAFLVVPLLLALATGALLAFGKDVVPVLSGAGFSGDLAAVAGQPFRILNSAVLYYASWHFAAQCYGLLRLYQRKSGEPFRLGHKVEGWFPFAVGVSGLLWRLHFGPRRLFGEEALAPPLPRPLVYLAMALVGVLAAGIVIDQVREWRAGGKVAWLRLAFHAAVVVGFWVPFLLIEDGTAAFAAAACWHGFQYLGIVYHYNRTKFRKEGSSEGARLVAWVSQPRRWWAYLALLWGLAGAVYAVIYLVTFTTGIPQWQVGVVTWTTLTLSHYWVDGLIWKTRTGDSQKVLLPASA